MKPKKCPTIRGHIGTSATMMIFDSDSDETNPQLKKKPYTIFRKNESFLVLCSRRRSWILSGEAPGTASEKHHEEDEYQLQCDVKHMKHPRAARSGRQRLWRRRRTRTAELDGYP